MALPGSAEDIARAHVVIDRMNSTRNLPEITHDPRDDDRRAPLRIASALERIADALEAQAAAQGATAQFFRSALPSEGDAGPQPSVRDFEDYCEAQTGHFLVRIGGVWLEGTPAEDAAIREMIQQRRNR